MKENKFVNTDILDAQFDGRCPSDATKLQEVDPKQAKCPRGGKELEVQEFSPLAKADSCAQ